MHETAEHEDSGGALKALLVITAIVEVGAGVALVVAPSTLARLLVGGPLDTPVGVVVGRIAGAALLALAIACWSARHDLPSRATRGIVAAMALYNCVAVAVLVYAATGGLRGAALWPVVAVHTFLAAWCLACLTPRRPAEQR